MDWPLLIIGLFAAVAIGLLFDALRNPERWHASSVHRWRSWASRAAAVTTAGIIGAGLAGASGATLGVIGVVGGTVVLALLRLLLSAAVNQARR